MLPFSVEDLEKAVVKGDVTKRPHPDLPLWIYNYSPSVQYSNRWNDVTLNCRGLILDEDFNIVARPWKKFFNLGQVNLPIQFDTPVEVMDKADGSLGILYPTPDGYAIATRGSFESEQAQHATALWRREYAMYHDFHLVAGDLDDYTFLFEIVYPKNRIVLNYDGMDDLILLGAVQNSTGYYLGPRWAATILGWLGPVVDVYDFNTLSGANAHMGRSGKEGFVIRSHNFMVKLKEPDYLELHRLVTNMTPKTIWEQLKSGKSVAEICAALPDEFHSQAEDIARPMRERYNERLEQILASYSFAMQQVHTHWAEPTRKNIASVFIRSKDAKYFFSLLDNRPINELLWSELKPKETVTSQED